MITTKIILKFPVFYVVSLCVENKIFNNGENGDNTHTNLDPGLGSGPNPNLVVIKTRFFTPPQDGSI